MQVEWKINWRWFPWKFVLEEMKCWYWEIVMIPCNPCFDELWFKILSSEMCIEMCIFVGPNNFTKVSCYSYRHLVFLSFCVLKSLISSQISKWIWSPWAALCMPAELLVVGKRLLQGMGQWAVGISKAVLKALIMETWRDGYIYIFIYIWKDIMRRNNGKNLGKSLTCDIVLLYDSCPRMEMYEIPHPNLRDVRYWRPRSYVLKENAEV